MNKKSFVLAIKMLTSNFGLAFDPKAKDDKAHLKLIFDILEAKGLTDLDFARAVAEIIWFETSLFGKLPTIAMFLKYAGKQEKDPKEQAILETNKIVKYVSGYYDGNPVVFDNATTNACVNGYGGIVQIARDVNAKSRRDWIVKSLQSQWLACFNDGATDNFCRGRTPARYYHYVKGKTCISENGYKMEGIMEEEKLLVHFIGDKVKCQELLGSSTKLLEEPKNEKMDNVIAELEQGWNNKSLSKG